MCDIFSSLYPFQREGVDYAFTHHYSINACQMGYGKTIQAIGLIAKVNKSALVVCPAYLRQNWQAELDKWLPKNYAGLVTVLSYEKFRNWRQKTDILIFDEAHYLKGMLAKRTKAAHNYVKHNLPEYLLLLTGTPIKNRVCEFYSLMKLCSYNPRKTSGLPITKAYGYFANALSYSRTIYLPNGGTTKKYSGLKNKPLLIKYLENKYFRRQGESLNLPSIVYKDFQVELEEEFRELEEDYESNHISTAKKEMAVAKASFTAKLVNNTCKEDEETSVLVFSDHVRACSKIGDLMTSSYQVITGKNSPDQRQAAVAAFQQKRIRVLICTIGSMNTGWTLTASNKVIFNDLSWSPADNKQAEKRIHRIGQKDTCFVTYMVGKGIDEKILENLKEKIKTIEKTLN